ncbi:flagellar biosynthesis protein FlhB [Janthinobacterium sp. 17J80-10]|uniref:flagellar biosynthesis protein FlhB n=1 Tax=Janthinobacterium sp. 17J80-10 TaxID=2497863 RepID=UPI00100540E0|nr:flagellar biosynthesis protein FlhB [Janthinobacterium sp. 17J80-10]QAU34328.1 flagellar type III secretion system protein FlhB [Janthinobacterium sp. 17J80-10]
MADDSDLERTEPASPRRLEQAREEGDVPRSRELATCTVLMAAGVGLWALGDHMMRPLRRLLVAGLSFERAQAFDPELLLAALAAKLGDVLLAFAPLAGLLILVALGSPLLIGGWLFSTKSLQPNFAKLNPMTGIGNMFSANSAVELLKAIAKTLLVGVVAWKVAASQMDAVMGLGVESITQGTAHLGHILIVSFISIVGALVLIALIDAPYQMIHYANKLKMTREELRQEAKESDGNPEIKAKIRQQQREMARRRMMSEIPSADVVVTNPTHYAVALKYTDGKMRAPQVVAKGADEVAAKIREIARENNVPLLEAPPLARALFRHAELGDEIPEALYTAVAEVLAYVFQLRVYRQQGGSRPSAPTAVDVPPELDPLNPLSMPAQAPNNGVMQ